MAANDVRIDEAHFRLLRTPEIRPEVVTKQDHGCTRKILIEVPGRHRKQDQIGLGRSISLQHL